MDLLQARQQGTQFVLEMILARRRKLPQQVTQPVERAIGVAVMVGGQLGAKPFERLVDFLQRLLFLLLQFVQAPVQLDPLLQF